MSITKAAILKAILLREFDRMQPEISTFEDDPMQFILRKYPGLNETLTYLMTPSFQEYITGIYIVAPKPTTFKVVLHNGQFFFLQFTGKTYQATVVGKNYYLMSIGEKERCMLAIARLLRYGNPIKTKGPEGAEQGTRGEDEVGGETAGGEETGGGEEAGAEEEPIAEAKVLAEILKKKLSEDAEKNTDLEGSDIWSKTLTVNDLSNKPKLKQFKTIGDLILNYIFNRKKIVVVNKTGKSNKASLVSLKFSNPNYEKQFQNNDYTGMSSKEKIFVDVNNNAYSISDIVKTDIFGGVVKKGHKEGEQKAISELQSEIDRIILEDDTNKDGINIEIGNKIYYKIKYVKFQEEESPQPKSDIVLVDYKNKDQIFISHKKGTGPQGFRSWSSVQNSQDQEVLNFVNKLKSIAEEKYGDLWQTMFVKDKKSYYTQINDELIKTLIYGKDVGSNTFGKNNVQIIIQGGNLKIEKKDIENNTYTITGYTKAWINSEIPEGEYRPILKAEYNSKLSAYGFNSCKVHAVTEKQKSNAEDISANELKKDTSIQKNKKLKIDKIQIPKEATKIIKSPNGETTIFVRKDWIMDEGDWKFNGLSKTLDKSIPKSADKEKKKNQYKDFFINPSSPINILGKVYMQLKSDKENKFDLSQSTITKTSVK